MPRPIVPCALLFACAALAWWPAPAMGQSVLERSPNLSGGWVAPLGVIQFDFVHRFEVSPAPERKVTSFPSFVFAAGVPLQSMVGFVYSTNSTLVSRYPNEWEFFGQATPVRQSAGHPVDMGLRLGYDLATTGVVSELSLARTQGRLRLLAAGRLLASPDGHGTDAALAGGAVIQLGRWLAVAGDVGSVIHRAPGERVAWSAALQLGIPHTPHTLSLQASNAAGISLESASRGTGQVLYGFEFTIPVTLARYFGGPARPASAAAVETEGDARDRAAVHMKKLAFGPGDVTIPVGTVVEWVNDDPVAHSVVAADSTFDSGLIEPGSTWRHLFRVPGTYAYACRPHPFMKGTITVVASP